MLDELKFQLERAQNRMMSYADLKRREVEYQVGDKVYLKLQPYRLQTLAKRINQKFSPRYYGPYDIIKKIGPVAYRLKFLADFRVHHVFHISLLKKCVSRNVQAQPLPAALSEG